jgi:hypothetical protein
MVTQPPSTASAGPVIKVMARLLLCRGPELNRRHMVLQVMRRAADENPSDLPALGIWSRDATTGYDAFAEHATINARVRGP